MIDLTAYRALTFDCYGTLIDWEAGMMPILRDWARRGGLALEAEALLEAFGEAEARAEAEQPMLSYPDILRLVLHRMSERYAIPRNRQAEDELAESVGRWPPFPDSPAALAALKSHYKLAILSNVDRASFAGSNRQLGVEFDLVVTAEDVGSYKPDERNFRAVLGALAKMGIAATEVLHVAQSLYHDHVPAQRLGLKSVWIDRRRGRSGAGATARPDTPVAPDAEYPSMRAFAEAVARAHSRRRDSLVGE